MYIHMSCIFDRYTCTDTWYVHDIHIHVGIQKSIILREGYARSSIRDPGSEATDYFP